MATLSLSGARIAKSFRKGARKPFDSLDNLGQQLSFYGRALGYIPKTLVSYKREVTRLLAEVSLGSGALTVIGGTVGVIGFICFFTGTEVGLQGYAALNQLGSAAFTGFISAYFNTREIAPLRPVSPSRPPSAAASPRSSGRCGSPRRSTRSRSWPCRRCPTS